MNKPILTISLGLSLHLTSLGWAQETGKPAAEKPSLPVAEPAEKEATKKIIGFVDADKDGINDRFVDANGDGKNDRDGKEYPHRFAFEDKNKDVINDLWIDQDGDGVNDLGSSFKDKMRHEVTCNVLDFDADGCNDVTGERYDAKEPQWKGELCGFWDESKGKTQGRMVDENADGIDDRVQAHHGGGMGNHHGESNRDYFIDEDGDGVCDGRGDVIRMMGRNRHGHQGGGKSGGHH